MIRRQEYDGPCQIRGGGDMTDGNLRHHLIDLLLIEVLEEHFRMHGARRDGIDGNAIFGVSTCQTSGEGNDSAFRR